MSRFAQYATGQAFHISLTKGQIRVIAAHALTDSRKVSLPYYDWQTYSSLVHKGILEPIDGGRDYQLTKEGGLLVPLLKACDLLAEHYVSRKNLPTLESIQESLNK